MTMARTPSKHFFVFCSSLGLLIITAGYVMFPDKVGDALEALPKWVQCGVLALCFVWLIAISLAVSVDPYETYRGGSTLRSSSEDSSSGSAWSSGGSVVISHGASVNILRDAVHLSKMSVGGFNENAEHVTGTGPAVREVRECSLVAEVRLEGPASVEFTVDETPSIVVHAQKEILPLLKTVMKGNQLRVYPEGAFVSTAPIIVEVRRPSPKAMSVRGPRTIT